METNSQSIGASSRLQTQSTRDRRSTGILILCVGFAALALSQCAKPSVSIGFLGVLTGRYSDLGVSGRNGAHLAIAELNDRGGVRGADLRLIVRDTEMDPDVARTAMRELVGAGVVAVVGPMTSDMSIAVLDIADETKTPLVSPTASTPDLKGLDDYFLRVNPPDTSEARALARYAFSIEGYDSVCIAYDLGNAAFATGLVQEFRRGAAEVAPEAEVVEAPLDPGSQPDYAEWAEAVESASPDAVFVIAGTLDSALLAQQLRKLGVDARLLLTGWAMTQDLIHHGGKAVEGAVFSHYFNTNGSTDAFLAFKDAYEARFGTQPDFVAALGYNAVTVIATALSRRNSGSDLKRAILETGTFDGIQGEITIDEWGDAELQRFFLQVEDGRIEMMEPPA